jgi:hypothetical protein
VRIFEDAGGCSEGKSYLDAVYDLGPDGSTDLPNILPPIKEGSQHPNFTKFQAETGHFKSYCARLTDASGEGSLNETLKIKSGIFRVLVNDSVGKQAATKGIQRLEDSVAPVQNSGNTLYTATDKKATVMGVEGCGVTALICNQRLRLREFF